jgi:hypothetical protein
MITSWKAVATRTEMSHAKNEFWSEAVATSQAEHEPLHFLKPQPFSSIFDFSSSNNKTYLPSF